MIAVPYSLKLAAAYVMELPNQRRGVKYVLGAHVDRSIDAIVASGPQSSVTPSIGLRGGASWDLGAACTARFSGFARSIGRTSSFCLVLSLIRPIDVLVRLLVRSFVRSFVRLLLFVPIFIHLSHENALTVLQVNTTHAQRYKNGVSCR